MNTTELDDFFKRAFIAFPNVWEWLKTNSQDVKGTLATWKQTLGRTDAIDANLVLTRWIEGALADPPQGYKIAMFAQEVRSVAERIKAARTKADALDEHRKRANIQPTKNPNYVSHVPYIARIIDLGKQFRDGLISQEECQSQQEQIVEEFNRAVDAKNKRVSA